jgi:hypothetical protein
LNHPATPGSVGLGPPGLVQLSTTPIDLGVAANDGRRLLQAAAPPTYPTGPGDLVRLTTRSPRPLCSPYSASRPADPGEISRSRSVISLTSPTCRVRGLPPPPSHFAGVAIKYLTVADSRFGGLGLPLIAAWTAADRRRRRDRPDATGFDRAGPKTALGPSNPRVYCSVNEPYGPIRSTGGSPITLRPMVRRSSWSGSPVDHRPGLLQ